ENPRADGSDQSGRSSALRRLLTEGHSFGLDVFSAVGLSVPAMPGDEALGELLVPGTRRGIESLLACKICELLEIQRTACDPLPSLLAQAGIALLLEPRQTPVGCDIGRCQRGARQRIDAANVSQIQVGRLH